MSNLLFFLIEICQNITKEKKVPIFHILLKSYNDDILIKICALCMKYFWFDKNSFPIQYKIAFINLILNNFYSTVVSMSQGKEIETVKMSLFSCSKFQRCSLKLLSKFIKSQATILIATNKRNKKKLKRLPKLPKIKKRRIMKIKNKRMIAQSPPKAISQQMKELSKHKLMISNLRKNSWRIRKRERNNIPTNPNTLFLGILDSTRLISTKSKPNTLIWLKKK